ncbi:MAG: hypothetical protein AAF483_18185 [Planctomycetota bacterium]
MREKGIHPLDLLLKEQPYGGDSSSHPLMCVVLLALRITFLSGENKKEPECRGTNDF